MENEKLRESSFNKHKEFHLKQANHNYIFCYTIFNLSNNYSDNENQFFDWVITSAFYSSLHYIRCSLSIDKEFMFYRVHFQNKSFDDARKDRTVNSAKYPNDAAASRHEILKRIVQDTYPPISAYYNMLFDKSMTSRYSQFKNATKEECESTLELLGNIRDWFSQKSSIILPVFSPSVSSSVPS